MDFIKPTVAIKKPNGARALISAADYDEKEHTLWTEADEKKRAASAPAKIIPAGEVEIPANWRSLKWPSKAKLARQINPAFEPDPEDRAGSAEAVIGAELTRRAEAAS